MTELNVVLATPPGLNPGMLAVEMSLHSLLRKSGLASSARIVRLMQLSQRLALSSDAEAIGLRCVDLFPESQLAIGFSPPDSGTILYWGDFLHSGYYIRAMSRVIARILQLPRHDAEHLVRRVLLLEGMPPNLFCRVLTFGTTLLVNSGSDRLDRTYFDSMSRFISSCRRVWVRDVISASKVAMLRMDFGSGFWGGDCVQMLKADDLAHYRSMSAPANWQGCEAGVFFGRTHNAPSDPIVQSAAKLCRYLGYRAYWIPWGSPQAFRALAIYQHAATQFVSSEERPTDIAMVCALPEFKLIITDTYHLALLGWTLGVPSILIYSKDRNAEIGVNNGVYFEWKDKRALLFSQYEAEEFLVDFDELRSEELQTARMTQLLSAIANQQLSAAITRNIRMHADRSRSDLILELQNCLRQ